MAHDHDHPHSHDHAAELINSGKNIKVAFWINTGFAILEVFGGLYTNSVAILSDALHDFGDSLSLGMAYYFHKKSARKKDTFYTYGYQRFSLLGAFVNSLVLIVGSLFILKEATTRISNPQTADAKGMLILAIIGISVNTFAMLRLRAGSSVNERVVSLHFLEDVLGWAAVLIGSIVMMFYDVPILDPILSILIALFILYNVYKNLRHSFRIILQGIPENIDLEEIKKLIQSRAGITGVHDIKSWTMDGQYNIMTLHLVLKADTPVVKIAEIKKDIRHELQHLNINHLTIETEFEDQACEMKE